MARGPSRQPLVDPGDAAVGDAQAEGERRRPEPFLELAGAAGKQPQPRAEAMAAEASGPDLGVAGRRDLDLGGESPAARQSECARRQPGAEAAPGADHVALQPQCCAGVDLAHRRRQRVERVAKCAGEQPGAVQAPCLQAARDRKARQLGQDIVQSDDADADLGAGALQAAIKQRPQHGRGGRRGDVRPAVALGDQRPARQPRRAVGAYALRRHRHAAAPCAEPRQPGRDRAQRRRQRPQRAQQPQPHRPRRQSHEPREDGRLDAGEEQPLLARCRRQHVEVRRVGERRQPSAKPRQAHPPSAHPRPPRRPGAAGEAAYRLARLREHGPGHRKAGRLRSRRDHRRRAADLAPAVGQPRQRRAAERGRRAGGGDREHAARPSPARPAPRRSRRRSRGRRQGRSSARRLR